MKKVILLALFGLLLVKQLIGQCVPQPRLILNKPEWAINGTTFFVKDDSRYGTELWKGDATGENETLVKDINSLATKGGNPGGFTLMNGAYYFAATDAVHGRELWKTDGTAAGTVLVKDLAAGSYGGIGAELFIAVGNTLFFSAATQAYGYESLCKSDGTEAGTGLLKDIFVDLTGAIAFNGILYFKGAPKTASGTSTGDFELWRSDGTEAGTYLVKDICTTVTGTGQSYPSGIEGFTIFNNGLYFSAQGQASNNELWKTDGTTAGTVLVKEINPSGAGLAQYDFKPLAYNGYLYFNASGNASNYELWRSDGTAAGTTLVKDISAGANGSYPGSFFMFNNLLFFQADDNVNGKELWRSDGTAAGTVLVKDFTPGAYPGAPVKVAIVGITLYLTASTSSSNAALFMSDGTTAGTVLIKNLGNGGYYSGYGIQTIGSLFYFGLNNVIYQCDGTNAGTIALVSNASNFSIYNGYGYHLITYGSSISLWRVNLATQDATKIRDGVSSSYTYINGNFLFGAKNLVVPLPDDYELWISDGTAAGTSLLKEINTATYGAFDYAGASNLLNANVFNGFLYFVADDGIHGTEIWKTDGTVAGTTLLKDIVTGHPGYRGDDGSYPEISVVHNGYLYFYAYEYNPNFPGSTAILRLWRTDGTTAGTVRLENDQYQVGQLLSINGVLLFKSLYDNKLYKTDGTTAGTVLLKNISPNWSRNTNGSPANLPLSGYANYLIIGNTLYFVANDGVNGSALWKTDGTAAGTVLVKDIYLGSTEAYYTEPTAFVNVNSTLFFSATDGTTTGRELWKSDGTTAGTVLVKDLNPGPNDGAGYSICAFNGGVLFAGSTSTNGNELWYSNGTDAGTVLVRDINPGSTGSDPSPLFAWNGQAYFAALSSTAIGTELWRTDGTTAGTVLANDIATGIESSYPTNFRRFGNNLFFDALTTGPGLPAATYVIQASGAGTGSVSAQSGDWNTAATWVCGQIPTATSPVQIKTGHVVTISSAVQAKQMQFESGAKIQYSTAGRLTINP